MKGIIIIILTGLLSGKILNAQNYQQQRTQIFVTNILSNALIGGIGGAINRQQDEKAGKAFLRNFLKGSVGGLVKYSAKYQTYYLNNIGYAIIPLNRLYFFLGHSVVMNAARDQKILSQYYCNFYGVDIRIRNRGENRLRARLSLGTLATAIYMGARGYELNLYRSLEQEQLYFDVYDPGLLPGTGQAGFNAMAFDHSPGGAPPSALPHEIVHTYQMYDYFAVSSFYEKPLRSHLENKWIFRFLEKFIVPDYEPLFFALAYSLYPKPRYFRNYFEFEAQHFWTRAAIRRN